jgi:hypothetical protein
MIVHQRALPGTDQRLVDIETETRIEKSGADKIKKLNKRRKK